LWALRSASANLAAFQQASHFAVNVLTREQQALSQRFASPVADRFAQGDWHDGEGGAPVLAGCTAVLHCATHQQLSAGDHVLFIGRVVRLSETDASPLLYHAGHYHGLGEAL
jgi:3-hydroxy-9,10-secoandrosta-1,3,5(10)-triene-9,17-dione monooxygenase reductase component